MAKTNGATAELSIMEKLAKEGWQTVEAEKPAFFPLDELKPNGVIDGVLKEIRPSLKPEMTQQPLLLIELTKDMEIGSRTLPAKSLTLVPVRAGIEVKVFADKEAKARRESRFLGKRIGIVHAGTKRSKNYKDATGQGTEFVAYEVLEFKGK